MSATDRGNTSRIEQDFYPTPPEIVDLILPELYDDRDISFLEPCRGNGVIYNKVPYINKQLAELSEGVDYLKTPFSADLCITNPPFSLAQEFLEKSLKECLTTVFLLRVNFLGSKKRYDFWQANPPTHLFVLSDRPAFVAVCKGKKGQKGCGKVYPVGTRGKCECGGNISDGTDATEYAWFCFDHGDLVKRPRGTYVI